MPSRKIALIVIAVFGGLAVVWGIARQGPEQRDSAMKSTVTDSRRESAQDPVPSPRKEAAEATSRTLVHERRVDTPLPGPDVADTTPPTLETVAVFLEPMGDPERPVLSGTGVMRKHFESELVDYNWSSNLEPSALEYFASLPAADAVNATMQCRTSICELIVQTRTAKGNVGLASIQNSVFPIQLQPWWKTFGLKDMVSTVGLSHDGRAIALVYMTKKEIVHQDPVKY